MLFSAWSDPMDSNLLAALSDAIQKDPDSIPLRLHLASLLLESGAEASALDHFTAVLAKDPTNIEALRGAARAAQMLGDETKSQAYQSLLNDLDSGEGKPAPATSPSHDSPQPLEKVPPSASVNDPMPLGNDQESEDKGWWEIEWPRLTLADVGGMEDVKRRLFISFLGPIRNPELRRAFGKSLRGGLLLYGPPGCGKTYLARATAGEMGARFMSIGLSDVLSMWMGESERQLHEIFETARRNAPCLVFFDEVDAIGQRRSNVRGSAGIRNVVNQLLAEMDGADRSNEGVFILGATNHPWDVDTALLRPGRFDRMALVMPPDQPARMAILRHHLKNRPAATIDVGPIAARTEMHSGADLAHICETATEFALEEALEQGTIRSLTMQDFERAMKEVRPSTRPWFDAARNYVMFANDGGAYDELQAYMREHKLL
jgi:SpoVK/Ycf46/Vps4 family AAA+-type ATPase